jgi:hypothetical protein
VHACICKDSDKDKLSVSCFYAAFPFPDHIYGTVTVGYTVCVRSLRKLINYLARKRKLLLFLEASPN